MADGSRHRIAYIAEGTYGTTPTTPAFTTIRNTGTSLGLQKEIIQPNELRADRQIADFRHGAKQVAGGVDVELSYGSFDVLLEALLGGTWAANVLKAGTTRRSFTIERFFGDLASGDAYHRFTGCEVDTLSLAINANAIVTGSFGFVGQGLTLASAIVSGATYPSASTTSPMDSFSGSIEEGGGAIATVTELSIEINNGLDPRYVVGSDVTLRPSIGRSNVTGSVTVFFENTTMLAKFINETESSIEVTVADLAGNSYEILLPRIKYNGGQPDVAGEGPITLAMPFQALLNASSSTQIQITRAPAA
jgi:hypothetical protein